MTSRSRLLFWMLGTALIVGAPSSALAASIDYGDFEDSPPGVVVYTDVTESSGTDATPLYGAPTITGNVLDFDPQGFVASAVNGGADITDGQLNFGLMILELDEVALGGLSSLFISESGDYTLLGAGTAATMVAAGVSASISILEVDGNAITPISLFASNSIVRDLASDGPVVLAPWSNNLLIEFAPILAENQIEFEFGVTKIAVAIDDQLVAISEDGTVAFIAKKDFRLVPGITRVPVPEPSDALLILVAVAFAARQRKRLAR